MPALFEETTWQAIPKNYPYPIAFVLKVEVIEAQTEKERAEGLIRLAETTLHYAALVTASNYAVADFKDEQVSYRFLVKTVAANRNFYAGLNGVSWNLTDNAGQRVPKGRYVIKITVQVEEVRVSASETISISDLIIANLRFQQVRDVNNRLIAVDILFESWPNSTGKVEVLTLQGALVKTVVQNASFVRGMNKFRWDLTDNSGRSVPNGIYLVRVIAQALGLTETLTKTLTIRR